MALCIFLFVFWSWLLLIRFLSDSCVGLIFFAAWSVLYLLCCVGGLRVMSFVFVFWDTVAVLVWFLVSAVLFLNVCCEIMIVC